jgi:hypothetical protein
LARELNMARTVWFIATVSMTIAIFVRQAICLGMHNPRRPIRWVCGAVFFLGTSKKSLYGWKRV